MIQTTFSYEVLLNNNNNNNNNSILTQLNLQVNGGGWMDPTTSAIPPTPSLHLHQYAASSFFKSHVSHVHPSHVSFVLFLPFYPQSTLFTLFIHIMYHCFYPNMFLRLS